jgi:phage FluMu gp28-like protein
LTKEQILSRNRSSSSLKSAGWSQTDLLSLVVSDAVAWAEIVTDLGGTPIVLEPFQVNFLRDKSNLRIVKKSRQLGYSTVLSIEVTHSGIVKRNYNADVVSTGEKEANEKIVLANTLWASTPDEFAEIGLKPVRWRVAQDAIAFHGPPYTSTIVSKPASSAIRGGQKDIYVDEAAFVPKFEELWQAAAPAIVRGEGRATVISTPMGESGLYFEMWKSGRWSMHDVPWWHSRFMVKGAMDEFHAGIDPYKNSVAEAIELAPMMGTLERLNRFGSTKIVNTIFREALLEDIIKFQTEFECMFVDEADSYYPWELIKENVSAENAWRAWKVGYETDGFFTIGVDLAKKRDKTVFTVVEHVGGKKIVLFYYESSDTYTEQFEQLKQLVDVIKPHRISIDSGGPGAMFAEKASAGELESTANIESIQFSNDLKEQWATKFKGELQMGDKVALSNHSKALEEIHSIKRKRLETGRYKFSGEPHDDYFWSTMLALYGADRVPVTFSRIG